MAFELIHKGKPLSEQQANAIVPVLNQLMANKISRHKFEEACEKAMEEAGVPFPSNSLNSAPK